MKVIGTDDGPGAVAITGTATGGGSTGVRAEGEGTGVFAATKLGEAVHAHSESPNVAALAAFNINSDGTGAAVFGEKKGDKGHAGFFVGNVHITRNLEVEGDVTLANVADFAEDFDVDGSDGVEPGTVMVLSDDETLRPSSKPYDASVVGVVSGAGAYKPGIILDKRPEGSGRQPIALLGKVYCKVDADCHPIVVGDLLTTSPTVGHAMKAADPYSAFGAVLGKALRALPSGQAFIPVLVTLQ
ncbi:hypothetical protein [Streptomyces sp. NPDC001435]|uniref:hypothetical protein n=1 Tax=unclassified Streptomyces TaxID=2593676 RepID=UPI0036C0CE98